MRDPEQIHCTLRQMGILLKCGNSAALFEHGQQTTPDRVVVLIDARGKRKPVMHWQAWPATGDRLLWANERFRQEVAAWTRPVESQARDGVPAYALGKGEMGSYLGPLKIHTFMEQTELHEASGSPVLAVLWTSDGHHLSFDCQCANQRGGVAISGRAEIIAPTTKVKRPRATSFPTWKLAICWSMG